MIMVPVLLSSGEGELTLISRRHGFFGALTRPNLLGVRDSSDCGREPLLSELIRTGCRQYYRKQFPLIVVSFNTSEKRVAISGNMHDRRVYVPHAAPHQNKGGGKPGRPSCRFRYLSDEAASQIVATVGIKHKRCT